MKLFIVLIVAVLAIAGIEIYALHQGINGGVMSITIGAITGIVGYGIKGLRERAKKPK